MGRSFKFFRENFQFIYSLILLIFIPVAIIGNNLWELRNNQKTLDTELKNKAVLAEAAFSSSLTGILNDNSALQGKIDSTHNSELKEITIFKPSGDGFQAAATSDSQSLNLIFQSKDLTSAWVEDESNLILVNDVSGQNPERYYAVIDPLKDANGNKLALIEVKVSLKDVDELNRKSINTSLFVLAVTIFFVLLLLINHFRFFEYAVLFKRLKEVDKMKDDFISIASHELKTPMAAIKGYMSMLFEGVAGKIDAKAKVHLEKINANVRRLDVLVNELLDVSRLEQQRVQFDMQDVDPSKVVKDVIGELKGQADEKKLYIRYQELPEPKPHIYVDPDRLAQIFDNLVGNAIKYTEKGGIEILHKVENGRLYTYVNDTGIGIAAADQKRLFEQFYRVQNRRTMDIPGTGLGLWITREIIVRMNGEISFLSKENFGSSFIVSFSVIKEK